MFERILYYVSDVTIPLVILLVVGMGILNRNNIFDDFVEGAKDGFVTVYKILPTLIGLMVGIGVMRSAGLLDFISHLLAPVMAFLHFPAQLVPLCVVKMFSSSAATSLLIDVYKEYGTDSTLGVVASVLMSCSETIFYTMSVYFVTAKVTKTRWTLTGALVATLAGIVATILIVI